MKLRSAMTMKAIIKNNMIGNITLGTIIKPAMEKPNPETTMAQMKASNTNTTAIIMPTAICFARNDGATDI